MKKGILYLGLFILIHIAHAYHIVGGEIEFRTLGVGLYRISLIQYRDAAQTDNTFFESSIDVVIFSNKDNSRVGEYFLDRVSISDVPYSNQECAIDELKTSKVLFSADVQLNPEDFSDEEGYYIVYERCCRNHVIRNINNPGDTGMKYVLEIPPLWKDGKEFINSSPTLLRPLSDYACVDQLYYTDFTGVDPDGDSLAYRLATPLNSSALAPYPPKTPKPHIEVSWSSGFSQDRMVPGSRPLAISSEGLLTVNPSETGVYVFSVIVEEWRDGVQLGEMQRDFQMLVVDGCNPPDPPVVGVSIPDRPNFNVDTDILEFTLSDDKCFEFVVTNVTNGETISLKAKGVNFDGYLDDVFQITNQTVTPGQDSLIIEVCMPGCPPVRDGPFIVDLIAADDACPVPQLDTARLKVIVEPPPNEFPTFDGVIDVSYTINEGDSLRIDVVSSDANSDSIDFMLVLQNEESPEDFGFELVTQTQESGKTTAELVWRTNCQDYDFSTYNNFVVGVYAEDLDDCEVPSPSVQWYNLNVILPPNTSPVVTAETQDSIAITLGDVVRFKVQSTDADMDQIDLKLLADGFTPGNIGMVFFEVEGNGEVESEFSWDTSCKNLRISENTTYELNFHSEDYDECQVTNADSKLIKIHVIVPPNEKPEFEYYADTVIYVNQLFEMDITAFDFDLGDSVTVDFFNPARLPRSEIIEFPRETGYGEVTSTFKWLPDCSLIDFGETSAFFEIPFIAYDDNCVGARLDTMAIRFEITETREQFNRFTPPNVFTPNGDGINDEYSLTNLLNSDQNLPTDNCDDSFQYFVVHDRNGTEVFYSDNREFSWKGLNVESGIYYYLVKYSITEYKGYIHVLK